MNLSERLYFAEAIRGVGVLAKHFFQNIFGKRDPNTDILERRGLARISTVQYPEEKIPYPRGYRGVHRLVPREDGSPRCVACYMCATVCPAQCIYIEAGETERESPNSGDAVIEKFPTKFVIDELRCVVCGFCVEACPKDAIRMDTAEHAPPYEERPSFNWPIPKLLRGPAVSHPSDPWEKRESSSAPPEQHKEAHTGVSTTPHDS